MGQDDRSKLTEPLEQLLSLGRGCEAESPF